MINTGEEMIMKRNIRWLLWPVLVSLCLGACAGPADKAAEPSGTSTESASETGEETEAETASDQTPETREGEGREPEGDSLVKGEPPVILSLMRNSQYDPVWDEGKALCHTRYSRIWLDSRQEADPGTGAQAFPQLARALEELNDQAAEEAAKSIKDLETRARNQAADGYSGELSWEREVWAVRADSQVTSLLWENSIYLGGAHGLCWYGASVFDSRTGRQLTLEEVVTNTDRLGELAAERMEEKYGEEIFWESVKDVVTEETGNGSLTWTAGYEGITLYFDPYELAPYSYGALTATILYEEEPDLFSEKIRQAPDSWAVQVIPGLEFDLGQDRVLDTVEASGMSDLGSGYEKLKVSVNGQESLTDMWFYSYTPYVVHSSDLDTDLLVVETTSDNDYEILWVYELDPAREGFQAPWQFSATGFFTYYQENENGGQEYGTHIFTDPKHFHLHTHIDLLSTYYGDRWYKITGDSREDGYLSPEQPWYDVDRGDYPLTLLVPLEMELEDTGELREFPEGTRLWIVRVEGNYVGFVTEDGTRCRVWVEPGWPGTVRGREDLDAEDIFAGMMFAG